MRHGARTLLATRERLERLADLCTLQSTDLGRLLLQGRRDHRQRRDELGVPIALQDLRGGLGGTEA